MKILGHPLHPMLVHFPIAFWSLATALDLLFFMGLQDQWLVLFQGLTKGAVYLIALGLTFSVPAMAAGLIDLASLDKRAEKTGLYHMLFMSTTWCLYLVSLVLHIKNGIIQESISALTITASLSGFITLAIGGYYGGELVYKHGSGHQKIK